MREHAHCFQVFRRERGNRGLCGGERRIRTPETFHDSLRAIQPEFGALIWPEKSILAGENLFASDSAVLLISPDPFVRYVDAPNLVTVGHQTKIWSSNLPFSLPKTWALS